MSDGAGPRFSGSVLAASLALLVVFVAAWEWLPPLLRIPEFILPGPSKVWNEFLRMTRTERVWFHTGITALEVVVGFLLGSLLGVLIGYVLGVSPRAELVLSPYILALQIAPPQGRLCAAFRPVARLHGLSEDPRRATDRILPGHG